MKVVRSIWVSTMKGTIGVVLGKDETMGYQQAYVASVEGMSEELDAQNVIAWGGKLSFQQAKGFFPEVIEENYKR